VDYLQLVREEMDQRRAVALSDDCSYNPWSDHGSSAINVRHPWNILLIGAQDFLSSLNPKTLITLPDLDYARWERLTISKEVWSTIGSAWDRLESVRFVDHMWQCYVEDENERRFFLPGVVHPSISLSWIFTPRRGRFDAARLSLLPVQDLTGGEVRGMLTVTFVKG
jgi:hypothetical protein